VTPDDHPGNIRDLEYATVTAACRLLRGRLRQHIRTRAACASPDLTHVEVLPLVLDAELSLEADALASWATLRRLWTRAVCDDPVCALRRCLAVALARAIRNPETIVLGRNADVAAEDVATWVQDFVSSVDEDELLKKEV
jgi:hypothetical protein